MAGTREEVNIMNSFSKGFLPILRERLKHVSKEIDETQSVITKLSDTLFVLQEEADVLEDKINSN